MLKGSASGETVRHKEHAGHRMARRLAAGRIASMDDGGQHRICRPAVRPDDIRVSLVAPSRRAAATGPAKRSDLECDLVGPVGKVADEQPAADAVRREENGDALDKAGRAVPEPDDLTHPDRRARFRAVMKASQDVGATRTMDVFLESMTDECPIENHVEHGVGQADAQPDRSGARIALDRQDVEMGQKLRA